MLITPAVLYETPDDTSGGGGVPDATPFQESGGSAPSGTPASVEQSPGPWASDLEAFPEDQRAAVDSFLREKVQPHVTRLEQSQANEGHSAFFEDFENNPGQTTLALLGEAYDTDNPQEAFMGLIEELFGEAGVPFFEAATRHALGEGDAEGAEYEEDDDGYGEEDEEFDLDSLPEDVQEDLAWAREQRGAETDQNELSEYVSDVNELYVQNQSDFPPGTNGQKAAELLAPFVFTHDGDIDEAFESYKQWKGALAGGVPEDQAAAASAAGLTPEQLAAAGPPATVAGGPSAGAPPTQQKYGSIGEAAAAFAQELKARNAPPTV